MTGLSRTLALAAGLTALTSMAPLSESWAQNNIYPTFGVHNPPGFSNCPWNDCVVPRTAGEPTDPTFPPFWSTNWTMYRVHKGYVETPPPYEVKPPAPLKEGEDYEVSYGSTYYDSTLAGPMGEGAMMEHYEKRCLPIFPGSNHYTCSFVSIGDRAFFLTYDDRPAGMPPCCLFSPINHAPRTDFIKHLPYAKGDSAQLDYKIQGYSIWVGTAGGPAQIGVSPDQTANGGILFGYAFNSKAVPDSEGLTDEAYRYPPNVPPGPKAVPVASPGALPGPYRKPQSFYFSGVAQSAQAPLPNAPIVTQIFNNFSQVRPDPAKTWDLVGKMCTGVIPECQLFNRSGTAAASAAPASVGATAASAAEPAAPGTWGSIPPK